MMFFRVLNLSKKADNVKITPYFDGENVKFVPFYGGDCVKTAIREIGCRKLVGNFQGKDKTHKMG